MGKEQRWRGVYREALIRLIVLGCRILAEQFDMFGFPLGLFGFQNVCLSVGFIVHWTFDTKHMRHVTSNVDFQCGIRFPNDELRFQ